MAPSPTGFLHVGGLRTALYNFLLARKLGGKFILRIEDTDQSRLVEGALENIVQTLTDFGLAPDEGYHWDDGLKERGEFGPYTQSKRLDMYKKYADVLVGKKVAYHCFCTPERLDEVRKSREIQKLPPKYDKHCLNLKPEEVEAKLKAGARNVIRLNVPFGRTITFKDLVHGDISFSTNDVDDQVLIKSDGFPTYHLAVVVDDHFMQISHVIRGDEWISSTPKHILLYEALEWGIPHFVHLPLLLSKTKKKLSKRDGDVSVKDFVAQGYLPEALINFVALLGWNPKSEKEIFSIDELCQEFALDKINKSGAVFDLEKLDWINGLYLRQKPLVDLAQLALPYLKDAGLPVENFPIEFIQEILNAERERLKKLTEIGERVGYFFAEPKIDAAMLVWKKSTPEDTKKNLQAIHSFLHDLQPENFTRDFLETETKKFLAENSISNADALWPLRVSLSGLEASPSPFEIMGAFGVLPNGKEIVLRRVNAAIEAL